MLGGVDMRPKHLVNKSIIKCAFSAAGTKICLFKTACIPALRIFDEFQGGGRGLTRVNQGRQR